MLLWVRGVAFEKTCTVSAKCKVSRVVPRLYEWQYKILKLANISVENSLVVVNVSYCSGVFQFNSRGWPALYSRYTTFVLRSSGDTKFVLLVEDSDIAGLSSITFTMKYLFALQF